MDVLSDVLRAVRLTGAIFFDVDASAPWVAATPSAAKIAASVMPGAEHVIMFHVITAGECWADCSRMARRIRFACEGRRHRRLADGRCARVFQRARHARDAGPHHVPASQRSPAANLHRRRAAEEKTPYAFRVRLSRLRCATLQSRAACFAARPSCTWNGGRPAHGATGSPGRGRDGDAPLRRRDGALQGGRVVVRGCRATPHRDTAEGCGRLAVRSARSSYRRCADADARKTG